MYWNSTKIITLMLQILLGRVASTNRSFRRNDKLSKIQIPNMQHLHTMMNIEHTAVVTHRIYVFRKIIEHTQKCFCMYNLALFIRVKYYSSYLGLNSNESASRFELE